MNAPWFVHVVIDFPLGIIAAVAVAVAVAVKNDRTLMVIVRWIQTQLLCNQLLILLLLIVVVVQVGASEGSCAQQHGQQLLVEPWMSSCGRKHEAPHFH